VTRTPYGLCLPCRCVRVIDGDTVIVSLPGSHREWRVRLLDCWAAELDTPQGRRARDFLVHHLDGADDLALFVPAPKDPLRLLSSMVSFDRVLAHVFLPDGRSVSEVMVAGGLATAGKPPKQVRMGKESRDHG